MSGRITAIERTAPGSPLTVYVDGRPALEISQEVAARLGLEVGMELGGAGSAPHDADGATSAGAGETCRSSRRGELAAAREAALRLLAVRARSRAELEGRLRRKGFGDPTVAETSDGLEAVGLLDDRAFARLWAEERVRLRPVGPLRLRRELTVKGVPGPAIDEVLRETYEEHDEVELALRALRKRAPGGVETEKDRSRLHAFLLRRGFTFDAVAQALEALIAETDDADSDV